MNSRRRIVALLVVAFAGLFAALAGSIHAATKSGNTLVIWTDQNRASAISKIAKSYETANPGVTISVVQKNFGDIETQLGTVAASNAPDIITAAHDWTGQLAANGLVQPLVLSAAEKKEFPASTLNAFSYGTAIKRLYGLPTQVENIGLVVNTGLVKVPKTFAQLEQEALAFKKKKAGNLAIAVQQGTNGDAYHMYPFFSGLGGYIFGVNKAGNLVPTNVGVANKFCISTRSFLELFEQLTQLGTQAVRKICILCTDRR